jgi:hypothetical protein
MAKQKQRVQKLRIGDQIIRLSPRSDVSAAVINEIVRHRAEPSAGSFWMKPGTDLQAECGTRLEGARRICADDLINDWAPQNKALAAALKAKGLLQ